MLGRDLQVLPANVAVGVLVLDADIREVDLPVEVRQAMIPRPRLDLLGRAVGPAVTVTVAPIAVLQEPLVLALQLAVEFDAEDACLAPLEPFSGLQVGPIELRVVRALARLICACVEGLAVV